MGHLFTPGSERALAAAAAWSSRSDSDDLALPELLLGLLEEGECRAALMLASRGIGPDDVRGKWPSLAPRPSPLGRDRKLSPEVVNSFCAAESRLADFPRPLALATEFMLLGILAEGGPVADWLVERGLTVEAIEGEIHAHYRHSSAPLPIDAGRPTDDVSAETAAPEAAERRSSHETPHDVPVWRILDAEANRAGEALRVVEDYVRFALDDRHLSGLVKSLRHDLAAAVALLPPEMRTAARETRADVGTSLATEREQTRDDADAVTAANLRRAAESLRSLEEYSKIVGADHGARFEALRYRTYTLERAVLQTGRSCDRLAGAQLYVLLDGGESEAALARLAEALVAAGVHVIQLRDKRLSDRQLVARARLLRSVTRGTGTLLVVNDRPDIARLCDADGVHVGQEELTAKDARAVVGVAPLVGVSTHSLEQARAAVLDGANYIGVGPVFPSATKEFAAFPGVELLSAVAGEIRLPAFAIGGMTLENLDRVLETGIRRVAVGAAITGAQDPAAASSEFLARLASAPAPQAR